MVSASLAPRLQVPEFLIWRSEFTLQGLSVATHPPPYPCLGLLPGNQKACFRAVKFLLFSDTPTSATWILTLLCPAHAMPCVSGAETLSSPENLCHVVVSLSVYPWH